MIGSIIGGAVKLGSSIWGKAEAAKEARKIKDNIQNQIDENQDWYDRRYNEDATQRADAQRLITLTEDALKKRNKAAQGTQAVMGGTTETVAAEKAANNEVLADTISQINAMAERRKDNIEQQYQGVKSDLNNQMNAMREQKAQAIAQDMANAGSIAADIESVFDTSILEEQMRASKKNKSIAQ